MQNYTVYLFLENCSTCFGWRYHPKHVEKFPEINKLCNVVSRKYIKRNIQSDTKKRELLKNPTKTELVQEKKIY